MARLHAAVSILAAGLAPGLLAQDPEAKLTAPAGAANDTFGASVASDGISAAVGAPGVRDGAGIDNAGAVYAFARDGAAWSLSAELPPVTIVVTNGDVLGGARFGEAVDVEGDLLVAGAPKDDEMSSDAGAAVVFFRHPPLVTEWTAATKLLGDDLGFADHFGLAVAVSGDRVAAASSAAVYVFERLGPTQWQQQAKLVPAAPPGAHLEIRSIDLAGDLLAVGAPFDDTPQGMVTGALYVFRRDATTGAWEQEAQVLGEGLVPLGQFGHDVALDGTRLATGRHSGYLGPRAVYVFERIGPGSWIQDAMITIADVAMPDEFGKAVALAGNLLVAGAPGDDGACGGEASCNSGAAYVFRRAGSGAWPLERMLAADAPTASDTFGASVAAGAGRALSGVPLDDDGASAAGSAYVFRCLSQGDANEDGAVDVADLVMLLTAWGPCPGRCPPLCAPDLDGDCTVGVLDLVLMLTSWD